MEDQNFGNDVTDEFEEAFELEDYQPDAFYLSLRNALAVLAREQQAVASVAA